MKLDALDHPKTWDLADRLGIGLAQTLGHLTLLWAFAARKAPRGDIGKWPDAAIARACDWQGDPAEYVAALSAAGWLDASDAHRLLVHDWSDHAERWVRGVLARQHLSFAATDYTAPLQTATTVACRTQPDDARGYALPGGLVVAVWERYEAHRRRYGLRKLKTDQAARALAALTPGQQDSCVAYTEQQGYQGLFPERFGGGNNGQARESASERVRRKARVKLGC